MDVKWILILIFFKQTSKSSNRKAWMSIKIVNESLSRNVKFNLKIIKITFKFQ